MNVREIGTLLGGGEQNGPLLIGWDESQSALPPGAPFFLERSYVLDAGPQAALRPQLVEAMTRGAQRISSDDAARRLAWHVYHRLFVVPAPSREVQGWPLPTALLNEDAGLLYLLTLFGGLRTLRELYQAHRVSDQIATYTLHDVQRWADHYARHHTGMGIAAGNLPWLLNFLRGEIFALGRLQFEPGEWDLEAHVFRHVATGEMTALSEAVRYRADGQRDGAGGVYESEGVWTAHLDLGAEHVTGYRIRPNGHIHSHEVRLRRAEWLEVLAPGDPVLNIHIPVGGRLDMDACRESLEEALRFFSEHFPELPFKVFACDSWLLDTQLEEWLPESSNLVRFQRQFYLLPVVSNGLAAFDYVFDGVPPDLRKAPRDSALRRGILDHVLAGGRLRGGGGFLLPQDVPAWGTDVYRQARGAGEIGQD